MTELEQRLTALGAALEVPPAPDLVPGVLSQLPARTRATGRTRRRRRPARRTLAIALAAALLVAGGAMAAAPTRHFILRVLGLRGVRIERVPHLPAHPAPPAGAGAKLGLGHRIPLTDVRHAVSFTVLIPPGSPAAYERRDVPGGRISFLLGRVLITEFRGTATPFIVNVVGPRTKLTHVQTPSGEVRADGVRLVGNVLLFDHRGVTVRIEGLHTLAQALALARSLH